MVKILYNGELLCTFATAHYLNLSRLAIAVTFTPQEFTNVTQQGFFSPKDQDFKLYQHTITSD